MEFVTNKFKQESYSQDSICGFGELRETGKVAFVLRNSSRTRWHGVVIAKNRSQRERTLTIRYDDMTKSFDYDKDFLMLSSLIG